VSSSRDKALASRAATRVIGRLVDEGNDLAQDATVLGDVRRQVEFITRATLAKLDQGSSLTAHDGLDGVHLGQRRAASDMHPAASLRAATICFQEIFPLLLERGRASDAEGAAELAVALQEVVGEVVLSAATGYVDHLLGRLRSVHLQERRMLAAQLHDSTAQSIASALQRLEYETVPSFEVRQILAATLDEVRAAALDLRQYVGDRRLDEALDSYMVDRAPKLISLGLSQTGAPRSFAASRQEEAFIIVRELLINALKHSGATAVLVHLNWQPTTLSVSVSDDGAGFNPSDSHAARMGLLICRERAESIDATLEIRSAPGAGTTAQLGLLL
jgi:signal transduction histidine kinase